MLPYRSDDAATNAATTQAYAQTEQSAENLAKIAQNPVANLIGVPLPDFAPNWQLRLQAQLMFPK